MVNGEMLAHVEQAGTRPVDREIKQKYEKVGTRGVGGHTLGSQRNKREV